MVLIRRVTEGEARRSVVERANDGTLEVVILAMRLLAGLNTMGAIVSTLALVWTADLRWLATLCLAVILGGVSGWLGFWTWGNADWRNDGPAQ
jgi:uncharacterized membrane protein YfcA